MCKKCKNDACIARDYTMFEQSFRLNNPPTCISGIQIDIITDMAKKEKILFVCLGNIVRSPLAENLFRQQTEQRGLMERFEIDSAGTSSYHIGEPPDSRMRRTAAAHGLEYGGSARQITSSDLEEFDLIIAMDRSNQRNILSMVNNPDQELKIRLMRAWDPDAVGNMDVPDPYYGGQDGFEQTFEIVSRSIQGLLEALDKSRG